MAFGPFSVVPEERKAIVSDTSLSIAGRPADAKTVGTKLSGKTVKTGATMTGGLAFASIGDTGTSAGVKWAGSTDGASIYYQTTAKDQGNLVLNLKDDSDCYLRIAKNGAFKSYFSPDDGNFHGNVNGKADKAGTADTANAVPWTSVTGRPDIGSFDSPIRASGSNYVRFTNGTQVCWGVLEAANYSGTYAALQFPVPFIDTNFYVIGADANHIISIGANGTSTSNLLVRYSYSYTDYEDDNVRVPIGCADIVVIGKWKY